MGSEWKPRKKVKKKLHVKKATCKKVEEKLHVKRLRKKVHVLRKTIQDLK